MRHTTFLKLQNLWKNLDEDLPFCTKCVESDIYSLLQKSDPKEYTILKPMIQQWLNFRTTILASEKDTENPFLNKLQEWIKNCNQK